METNASHGPKCGLLFFIFRYFLDQQPLVAFCVVKIGPNAQIRRRGRFTQSGSKGQSLCVELLCGRRSDVVLFGVLFSSLQLGKKQDTVNILRCTFFFSPTATPPYSPHPINEFGEGAARLFTKCTYEAKQQIACPLVELWVGPQPGVASDLLACLFVCVRGTSCVCVGVS